ncbi:hypothetical protein PI124_g20186 [Phytophthora idaei]|nr:hypothetical protein PI125_g24347 [Phytophthora idaei]KAG3138097.1 hypothetical protein PI126_g17073 [Phytophthora idaei]KAG3234768.1 hypothetical protein PI124_g20186 [Phytophthora idaei]
MLRILWHPREPRTVQWAYGAVVRYEVNSQGASLSVLSGEESVSIQLIKPLQVIKADPITYALQVGGTVSDMILNSKELLHQQNSMIGACRKKRGDLPGSVRTMLSVPFNPDDRITLVRPSDLSLASVRRQHVLD